MKENTLTIGRREFTLEAVLAILSGAVITISGCGGSSYNSPSPPTTTMPPATGDKQGTISANHGHVATITGVQLTAGQAIVGLDIRGSANHTHTISLSASEVASIAANQRVSTMSTTNESHDHTVTFN